MARTHTTRHATIIAIRVATMVAAMVVATIAVALSCTPFCPSALADTDRYATYDHVRISALVEPDGDLRIRERFTVSYTGTFHGMYWVIDDQAPEILSAGEYVKDEFVPYTLTDATSTGPGTYAISKPPKEPWLTRVDLHLDKTDETAEYLLEYRLPEEACRWADTSELRWEFVGDAWDNRLNDVVCDLYVERPEDSGTWAGENVFAWLYRFAETSEVEDIEDGVVPPELAGGSEEEVRAAHVHCTLDEVGQGHNARLTVLFPADWLFERVAFKDPQRDKTMQEQRQEVEESAQRKAEKGKLFGPSTPRLLAIFAIFTLIYMGLHRFGFGLSRDRSHSGGGRSSGGGGSSGSGGHGGGSY